ncbi:Cobalamin biosynthesis protein CobE [Roseibacterium elongatum DSM 19469]|uniref:Cobalamin biosynthesis protein CobE n=1 Tax=Roseicyclus elongatus DSM 19469 TaxID=1294273 RepID=W8SPR8_9RHOB|nr:cobalamin biosynthesis protein [Roseibacterium elongatum]AHM04510.1 Cobalamin biosynthesis protein CobE [Roseibacterium elongatum DSM 19469]
MIVAGFGFRGGATRESLAQALALAAGARRVAMLATAEDKAQTAVFSGFARAVGLPVQPVDAATLSGQETATQSAQSQAARGTGSLAEAAALAAAGPGARLIAPRVISGDGMATCALAERDET